MRDKAVLVSLLLLGAGALGGCGQKGPLVLPPPKPVVPAPTATAHPPAPASSLPAPSTSAASSAGLPGG